MSKADFIFDTLNEMKIGERDAICKIIVVRVSEDEYLIEDIFLGVRASLNFDEAFDYLFNHGRC